jgi:hypothetical protein
VNSNGVSSDCRKKSVEDVVYATGKILGPSVVQGLCFSLSKNLCRELLADAASPAVNPMNDKAEPEGCVVLAEREGFPFRLQRNVISSVVASQRRDGRTLDSRQTPYESDGLYREVLAPITV